MRKLGFACKPSQSRALDCVRDPVAIVDRLGIVERAFTHRFQLVLFGGQSLGRETGRQLNRRLGLGPPVGLIWAHSPRATPSLPSRSGTGTKGQHRVTATTKISQAKGICRKGVTTRGRACRRLCSLGLRSAPQRDVERRLTGHPALRLRSRITGWRTTLDVCRHWRRLAQRPRGTGA